MKNFLFTVMLLSIVAAANCGIVTRETAGRVAANFCYESCPAARQSGYCSIKTVQIFEKDSGAPLYYICTLNTGGFVIVSASDNTVPVLAYSFDNSYDPENISCCFSSWMKHYENQIHQLIISGNEAVPAISEEWKRLASDNPENLRDNTGLLSVAPLLVSKWNQGSPYNAMCPPDPAGPGGHCYAGCVATAMGQLLYYYRYPQQGAGSYAYYLPDYGTISADFGSATYQWDAMPSYLSRENDAVATLLFHLGVSVDMDYGPDGSGMWNHKAAYSLRTYFGYGPETKYYFRDSTNLDWDSILVASLDQRKPLYYAGWEGVQSDNGHAFVCDGYQGTGYFHFNWGWGGSNDGYFYLDNLTPGGNNFNYAQEVIPLFPDTLSSDYPPYCSGNKTLSSIDGSVEDGSGWFRYQPGSDCSWLIQPDDAEHDSVSNIKLIFNAIDTDTSDSIVVYDGDTTTATVLGSFSGNTLPAEITSGSDRLLVTFSSNASNNLGGWIADYRSTLPVYCSGQTTLTATSGSFSDGSGDKRYNNNSVCKWRIEPPGADFVTLWFTSFSTADTLDKVIITDLVTHEQLGEFSGSEMPPPVTATSGKMLLIFFTSNTGTGEGWDASYVSSGAGEGEPFANSEDIFLAPNPANDNTFLYYQCKQPGLVSLEIKSLTGKTIRSWDYQSVTGMNKIPVGIEDLSSSAYVLFLTSKNMKKAVRLIVN
ncbi:MAG TPA: C10 family peptidase [Bacteroidales bacterium]|nr:C10 family peptidase [Bacteroidales bacterium]HPT01528.1 C10 family peptidase [Bacteroidales bacterium]